MHIVLYTRLPPPFAFVVREYTRKKEPAPSLVSKNLHPKAALGARALICAPQRLGRRLSYKGKKSPITKQQAGRERTANCA